MFVWTFLQGYLKFLINPPPQVCWGRISSGKKEKGKQYLLPLIMRLLGRISSGEKGKGSDMSGKKINI